MVMDSRSAGSHFQLACA